MTTIDLASQKVEVIAKPTITQNLAAQKVEVVYTFGIEQRIAAMKVEVVMSLTPAPAPPARRRPVYIMS